MLTLTNDHIDRIEADVSKAGISLQHLQDELIDHICCLVEDMMHEGKNFDQAYQTVKQQVGVKELKQVQEDTLLLIEKNYRLMKTSMKVFGMVSMVLIAFGALFKIMHWPGASIILTVGFLLLGAVFFPSAIWVMRKESKLQGSILLYLSVLTGGVAFIFGVLFKIMHWPGSAILLLAGFVILCLIFLPLVLAHVLKTDSQAGMKPIYILGFFSLLICIGGMCFKMFHWPGAGIMLIVGFVSLVGFFFPLYVWRKYKEGTHIQGSFIFLSVGVFFFTLFTILIAMNVSKPASQEQSVTLKTQLP